MATPEELKRLEEQENRYYEGVESQMEEETQPPTEISEGTYIRVQILQELQKRGVNVEAEITKHKQDLAKQPGFAKQVLNQLYEDRQIVSFATGGSIVGGIVGGPPGAMGGAFVGGALGYAIKRGEEAITKGIPFIPPGGAIEIVDEAAKEGALMALGEGVGQIPLAIARGGAKAMVGPQPAKYMPLAQEFEKTTGVKLTPGQTTQRFPASFWDNIARGGWLSAGKMQAYKEVQDEAVERVAYRKLGTMFGDETLAKATPEQISGLVYDALEKGEMAHTIAGTKLYNTVDEMIAQAKQVAGSKEFAVVGTEGFKRGVEPSVGFIKTQDILDEAIKNVKFAPERAIKRVETITGISLDPAEKPYLSFGEAHYMRSIMGRTARGLRDKPEEAYAYSAMSGLVNALDENMTKSANEASKVLGKDIRHAYDLATGFWKGGKGVFNDEVLTRLISKTDAGMLGRTVFRAGTVENWKTLEKAVHRAAKYDESIQPERVLESMRFGYARDMVETSMSEGVVDGAKLLRQLENPRVRDTMEAALRPDQIKFLDTIARGAKRIKSIPGEGKVAIQLIQTTAGLSLLTYATYGQFAEQPKPFAREAAFGGAIIMLGPRALSILFTNPKTIDYLTKATLMAPTNKLWPPLAGKLGVEIVKANLMDDVRVFAPGKPMTDIKLRLPFPPGGKKE